MMDSELNFSNRKTKKHASTWATSYGDVITLLLVFFIVLSAASNLNAEKFEKIQDSLAGKTNEESTDENLEEYLSEVLQKHGLSEFVTVVRDEDGVLLIIKENLLFKSAQAKISAESNGKMIPLISALKSLPDFYKFSIEGHSDNVPIYTKRYESNWALSSARSVSVLHVFLDQGIAAGRLSAIAFADQKPMFPNSDKKGRPLPDNQRKNRRVVIRVK